MKGIKVQNIGYIDTIYGITENMLELLCCWLFLITISENVLMLENNSRWPINCLYIWEFTYMLVVL